LNAEGERIVSDSAEFYVKQLVWEDLELSEISMGVHETTSIGTIVLEDIKIERDQLLIFRIEEIRAPEGYMRVTEPFYLKIDTVLENREFIIVETRIGRMENGEFIENSREGISASIEERLEPIPCGSEQSILCFMCWGNPCWCSMAWYMCFNCGFGASECICNYYVCECGEVVQFVQVDVENRTIEELLFNLALRTFIAGVETNGTVKELDRAPIVSMPQIFEGMLTYSFPINKADNPVQMGSGSIMTQTIRIFNEGTIAGYVREIRNDIPVGLEFLPMHSTNLNYEWVMHDISGQVTTDVSEAVEIRTRYLESNQIEAFDPDLGVIVGNPDYRDIQVAFKVTDQGGTGSIIVSRSEIIDAEAFGGGTIGYINLLEEEQDTEYMYVLARNNGGNNNNVNNNDDDGLVKGVYTSGQGTGNAVNTVDDTNVLRYVGILSIAVLITIMVLLNKKFR